jgi:hypothetical protein
VSSCHMARNRPINAGYFSVAVCLRPSVTRVIRPCPIWPCSIYDLVTRLQNKVLRSSIKEGRTEEPLVIVSPRID